ncbi:MAG: ABC transporter ATP-binding protein, partial [Bacteroidota bacterium]
HYQQLDLMFYKVNSTGDLMSRISEDVSRVRMYTGPALMYLINLIVLISISLYYMLAKNALLSIYVLSPLPFLAIAMYFVNTYINRKSERIQEQLSDLTTHAQESYSGIRVIKSFAQEHASLRFFDEQSEAYRKSGLVLSALEAIYFPSIALLIGLSTLLTIYIGSRFQLNHTVSAGTIAEFVVYINMLTFPVSAIGWVASNIQRAAASQKRINAFLNTQPDIQSPANALPIPHIDSIQFDTVSYRYPHTGIRALHELSFRLERGQKMAIIGKTGSGKTTIAQLLIRLMDPDSGTIHINGIPATHINLRDLRSRISIVPQDVFLFSDSIENNIAFGDAQSNHETATEMARDAFILDDINSLPLGMNTTIGERGVTLSGGQKQRISIARALSKEYDLLILDDCLSAVDARTESAIAANLNRILKNKTTIVITHRPIPSIHFDWVLELEGGLSLSIKKSN